MLDLRDIVEDSANANNGLRNYLESEVIRSTDKSVYCSDPCTALIETGDCVWGDECFFTHSLLENEHHPDNTKRNLCSEVTIRGGTEVSCPRLNCPHAHSLAEVRRSPRDLSADVMLGIAMIKRPGGTEPQANCTQDEESLASDTAIDNPLEQSTKFPSILNPDNSNLRVPSGSFIRSQWSRTPLRYSGGAIPPPAMPWINHQQLNHQQLPVPDYYFSPPRNPHSGFNSSATVPPLMSHSNHMSPATFSGHDSFEIMGSTELGSRLWLGSCTNPSGAIHSAMPLTGQTFMVPPLSRSKDGNQNPYVYLNSN